MSINSRIKKLEQKLHAIEPEQKIIVPPVGISDSELEKLIKQNPNARFVIVESVSINMSASENG
jgi:hypothetical protein